MTNDKEPPFAFPSVSGKKVAATFDGGRLTSNSGVLLLALIEKQMKIAARLAALIPDRREAV